MKLSKLFSRLAALLLLPLATFTGCESSDSGGSTHVTSNTYYGVGFYDPYYHGHYDDDYDVVVHPPSSPDSPPGVRPPPGEGGAHPSQPIARPPAGSSRPPSVSPRPAARPSPSIPSTPRAAPRGGGGRRR